MKLHSTIIHLESMSSNQPVMIARAPGCFMASDKTNEQHPTSSPWHLKPAEQYPRPNRGHTFIKKNPCNWVGL